MIKYSEALLMLINTATRDNATEFVSLSNVLGRYVSQDILSAENFPRFRNSTVDGFALRSLESSNAANDKPLVFNVEGSSFAGQKYTEREYPAMSCCEIATGAIIPECFDTVIMKEDVSDNFEDSMSKGRFIYVNNAVITGVNVRYIGSDISEEQLVLEKGTRICLQHLPMLSALGINNISVYKKPHVGILATGDELVEASQKNAPEIGKVRNATTLFLQQILLGFGCEVTLFNSVDDSLEHLTKQLVKIKSSTCDILLTTGAVSVGKRDFLSYALQDLNANIMFQGVSMRPGKPTLVSQLERKASQKDLLVFSLPGNPMATVTAFRFLVLPYLQTYMGQELAKPMRLELGNSFGKSPNFTCFLLAKVIQNDQGLKVYVPAEQESFRILPLSRSNAWVYMPEICKEGVEGNSVEVYPLFFEPYFSL